MSDSYVTSQATIRCSCGDKCAKLTVYPDRTVFLTEKPMANISDHVSMYNIAPFGKCHTVAYPPTGSATAANHGRLTPMPCVPGTVSEWINGKSDYIVKGKPALLKSSYCRCKWGGVITITDDGQVDTGNPNLDKQQIESEEEWNTAEKLGKLSPEQLLDGIQIALDAAGFIPGLGAIPDLINAGISALRGHWTEAGLSVLAAVPLVGDVAAGIKIARKGYKNASNLSKIAKASIGKNVDVSIKGLVAKGMTKDEAVMLRRAVRNERKNFAKQFYENAGFRKTDIDSHLRGIDFKKPVSIETVPPPQTFYQYQSVKNGKLRRGNYYTSDINAKPTDLGIHENFVFRKGGHEFGKYHITIDNVKPQNALVSTAYGTMDSWSVPGKSYMTKGGAIQYFMPIH